MKILVVGSGGREHAIIKEIAKNPKAEKIFFAPQNNGIAQGEGVEISATDIDGLIDFVKKNKIDYVIVSQDNPLSLGLVDRLEAIGVRSFGPLKNAALLESSKSFAKELMRENNIPTADYHCFDSYENAKEYIENHNQFPVVIKADGLALGKGVIIAENKEAALKALKLLMVDHKFGESGNTVVVEEFLEGPEVTVLALTDGETIYPLVSSMDHKRIGDGDTGENTGGMGVIAPNPYYTEDIARECMEKIYKPTINAMKKRGTPFKGCLYFGLMLTKKGVKVIEYNARFGDPEAQTVLPLLKNDLLTVMESITDGRLKEINLEMDNSACCCVVIASKGYPEKYETGKEIILPKELEDRVFMAGAKKEGNRLLTSGGRVLSLISIAPTLEEAIKRTYSDIDKIKFDNSYYRKDIGAKALDILGNPLK